MEYTYITHIYLDFFLRVADLGEGGLIEFSHPQYLMIIKLDTEIGRKVITSFHLGVNVTIDYNTRNGQYFVKKWLVFYQEINLSRSKAQRVWSLSKAKLMNQSLKFFTFNFKELSQKIMYLT